MVINFKKFDIYIYIYIPVNTIARLPHSPSGNSKGQETFLAPPADKQTRNYDTECSNHHPSLSTLRPKGLSRSKMKWWEWWAIYIIYIYIYIYIIYNTYIMYIIKFQAFLLHQDEERWVLHERAELISWID